MFTEHCLHAEKIEPGRAGWSYIHCIVVALLYTMYSRLLVYTLTVGASSSA